MFCMNCGRELPEEARFCRYCGTKTTPEDEMPGSGSKQKPLDGPLPVEGEERPELMSGPGAVPEGEERPELMSGPEPVLESTGQPELMSGPEPLPESGERPELMSGPEPVPENEAQQRPHGGGQYPEVPAILQQEKKPYIPPIMPPMVTDSPKGIVYRVGRARDVEKITQVGVELSGIGAVVLLIRMILLAFISWKQSLNDVAYKGLSNDKSVIFTVLLSFIFLLATCILNGKKNRFLWLGFFPPGLLLIDCVVEMIKTSSSYPSDYYGYNVGWSVYKGQILVYGGLMLVYLLPVLQRKSRSRSGAVLLAFASLLTMGIFLWDTKDTAFIAVKISDMKMAWYELFTGISHICFFMPYFALALREMLADKEKEE